MTGEGQKRFNQGNLQVRLIQVGHTWPRAEIRSNVKDDQRLSGTLALDLPGNQGPGALIKPCNPDIASPPF